MRIKRETRVLGLDDAPFNREDDQVLVVGTVFRGAQFMDGVLSTHVQVDGDDATRKIIEMVNSTRHKPQLQVIMLDGIAFGGFNVVDVAELNRKTGLPVIVVIRRRPDMEKIRKALEKLDNGAKKLQYMTNAGDVHSVEQRWGKTFFQVVGMDVEMAVRLIKETSPHGLIPEPIRVAHLISRGVTLGESVRRA